MQASVDRVRALMSQATKLGDIVALEAELSRRQADLEATQSQLAALKDSVAMSPVEVRLSTDEQVLEQADDDTGFLAGLKAGWTAFTGLGHRAAHRRRRRAPVRRGRRPGASSRSGLAAPPHPAHAGGGPARRAGAAGRLSGRVASVLLGDPVQEEPEEALRLLHRRQVGGAGPVDPAHLRQACLERVGGQVHGVEVVPADDEQHRRAHLG